MITTSIAPLPLGAGVFENLGNNQCINIVDTKELPCETSPVRTVMKVLIKKWGNSAAVRIPASVMAAADLSLDQAVDVTQDGGRVIVAPIGTAYDLDQLVSQMDPDTFPEDADFGPPVGREAW